MFLHPFWDKTGYTMHATGYARYHLDHLLRERIALVEGFDETRTGLVGTWLASNAILQVIDIGGGQVKAVGWKWEQGAWKEGCDYDMTGKVVAGRLSANGRTVNPDTLERDGATLVVNREDDAAAARRTSNSGDEQKCKRRLDVSSTARLFPAKPSPDIEATKSEIR